MDRAPVNIPALAEISPAKAGRRKKKGAFSFFTLLLAVLVSAPLKPSAWAQSAEDLAAAVQASMESSAPIPGLTPDPSAGSGYSSEGIGSMISGSEDSAVRKKYVYEGASRDGIRFYGVALPKRVFDNVPPRF